MTKAFRIFSLTMVSLTALAVGVLASAGGASADPQRYVSTTVKATSSGSSELYRVPTGSRLLVQQACQEHPAMHVEVGVRGQRISYNGHGCTKFTPGYTVGAGETVNCVNKSGQTRSCVLVGTLEKAPRRASGARFIDVDKELARSTR